jgi:transposase
MAWRDCTICRGPAGPGVFPPEVELHAIDLACTVPDQAGTPLSQWDSTELARRLVADGVVPAISPATVYRLLRRHRLHPWRCHLWLHPRRPRDAAFLAQVRAIAELYTRTLLSTEIVLSVDEITQLQPRPRAVATRPAGPGRPLQLEHEYRRAGALNLIAAFDTRTGEVSGYLCRRKRQPAFIRFLRHLEEVVPTTVTTIHLIGDNVSVHHGREVQRWLAQHPRLVMHFTPVHSSWMNQVEQWFSILRRKRLRHANCADLMALADAITAFVEQWNATAHPFRWTAESFDKVIAKVEAALPTPIPLQEAA